MARGIYEIRLKKRFIPALTTAEAVEMWNCDEDEKINEDKVEVNLICKEEDTVKLFVLATLMYDSGRFECNEIQAGIENLARTLGYEETFKEISDCIINWIERMTDDMTLSDIEEWLIG